MDAIYLYGSRAKQTAHEASDWDIAVIFSDYKADLSARLLRPQLLEAAIERELKLYNQVSVVDLETAPVYLQYSILMSAVKWFDRNVPHVKRVEQSILSKWEKDYERYCLWNQIANNSPEQALLGGFVKAIDDAVLDSSAAHQDQMMQLLSDPIKAANFSRVVFDLMTKR